MLPTIKARKLLNFPMDELKHKLAGNYLVVFDDKTIETNAADLVISRSSWIVHEVYDKTPLTSGMLISAFSPKGYISLKDFISLSNKVFWKAVDSYPGVDIRDELSKLTYQGANNLYNSLVGFTMPYMSSLDAADFIEITQHPAIREATDNLDDSAHAIGHAYEVAENLIKKAPEFDHNRECVAIRSGTLNLTQAMQTTVVRGHMQDISTRVFKTPVKRPYIAGIRDIYESMIESRGAAISLSNSQSPLQQSEYFSRRLQLLNMSLRSLHIHPGDCGSTKTINFLVTKTQRNHEGQVVAKSNLANLEGVNYYDNDGILKQVKKTDKHLEGTYIRMRSVVAGCSHPDPYGICATCYGGLADTVPKGSSISHLTAAILMQIFGQGILSLKHRIGSAMVDALGFAEETLEYLVGESTSNDVFLRKEKFDSKANYSIIFTQDDVPGLVDLRELEEYERMGITRISSFSTFKIAATRMVDGNEVTEYTNLYVQDGNRKASLSYAALDYIKGNDYSLDKHKQLTINLDEWDFKQPLLTMPATQYSISEHQDDVARLIEGTAEEIRKRELIDTPDKILNDLVELVNSKLDVNVSILSTILYGGMVVSMLEDNYALPKSWTTAKVGVLATVIAGRSLAGVLSYEEHVKLLNDVNQFTRHNRLDHPMDVYFTPEALEHEKRLEAIRKLTS